MDSGLVQTVLSQFLTECSEEDKTDLIGLLAPHIVVISNSKDGARAAMQCIWHGTNKDRKVTYMFSSFLLISVNLNVSLCTRIFCLAAFDFYCIKQINDFLEALNSE